MNFNRIVIEDKSSRELADELIQVNDSVRIAYSLDDHYCRECDYSIGVDDEMYEMEGYVVTVEKVHKAYSSACGATVFSADGWMWTTCWIDRFMPKNPPRESWTV